jgi:hypothetical protein
MFDEIGDIRNARKRYNVQMRQSGIKTFRELHELESNALKDGALAQQYKELIALGISIHKGCYG